MRLAHDSFAARVLPSRSSWRGPYFFEKEYPWVNPLEGKHQSARRYIIAWYCHCMFFTALPIMMMNIFFNCNFYGRSDIFHTQWRKPPVPQQNLSGMGSFSYELTESFLGFLCIYYYMSRPGTLRTLVFYQKKGAVFGTVIAQTRGRVDSTYFVSVKFLCFMNLYVLTCSCSE